ncbi:P-loop containing nucleoside triphosphate hydrolase protein [Byssothecium circinans]|uniref:P-loop containing nucleoside triphosphate hydrolase protein n=1 Tax=Byssothecium circinans TaxID=147558 RepID=A0A6A5TBB8_9PLEO|nr:P-loop containing nucleoside triphosphate hydrolase protein [Byssothecium circinans]
MATVSVKSDSLDKLQSPEQVALLDAVDKLRNQGLGHYDISLPQLIVCGDQSSGKSSVLEGLTRLRFPTKDGLCTTFATELVLRRHVVVEISCTIIPSKTRSHAEREELSKFRRCFASSDDFTFPSLLEEARDCMSFGVKSNNFFFEDVLQIRYTGPDLPSLTIVDLPGIIHSELNGKRGVDTVRQLVRSYMADQRSIILAVVSAKSDPQTQGILNYVKELDPSSSRTLGIITKPDYLHATSDGEKMFLRLARNEEIAFDLGWHVVKNRGFTEREQSDTERDESERQFFATGVWATLPRSNVGIETLRSKLSRVLLQHIRKELPSLTGAIQTAINTTESLLKSLGDPRDEPQQQRNYLMEKAQRFGALTLDSLRGIYSDDFFKLDPSNNSIPPARLRTKIQDLNMAFAVAMYSKGHQYRIIDASPQASVQPPYSLPSTAINNYNELSEPIDIHKSEYLESHIGNQVRLSRPSGLPSLVNPGVIGEVFRQQSKPWEAVARQHLSDVYDAVLAYLYEVLNRTMDTDTLNALMQEHIEPELEKRQQLLNEKLEELLIPFQKQEPITYDASFAFELEQTRMSRYFEHKGQPSVGGRRSAETQLLTESVDDFTNCEILNMMNTYYKKAISVFISNVTVLAIENCLITDLPSLLNPELVLNMDEEKLFAIASESEDVRNWRAALKQKLEDLRAGKRVLDSQARRSGKVIGNTLRPQRVAPSMPTMDSRPRTPTPRQAAEADEQVDELASSFTRINVTPPPSQPKELQPQDTPVGAPLTPPKSPKPAVNEPPPKWKMRARVDDCPDSDAEEDKF